MTDSPDLGGPVRPSQLDPSAPADPADLIVDDDDRAHVMSLLEDSVGRGLTDTAEFDRRSGLATTARTRRDLNALVVDLPLSHPDRARAQTTTAARSTATGTRGDDRDTTDLRMTLASVTRQGVWAVPRRLEIDGWLGSAELDLTEAVIDHDVVEIDVDVTLGSVTIRVPDTVDVSLDGLLTTAGNAEDHRPGPAGRARTRLVVTGRVTLGSVEVRGPGRAGYALRRRPSDP